MLLNNFNTDSYENYLSDIGYPTIFENVIYPGMKQCITGAMIAHKDKIDKRGNCFELYGADFMLSETFEPWMLEINSNPALHPSTPVTAKLCPEVLEDVIKVVVDSARNPHAGTGNFELIYRENVESKTVNAKENLEISGSPLPNEYFCDIPTFESSTKCSTASPKEYEYPDPGKFLMQTGETMKHALKTLLDLVKREKIKRRSRKEKSIEVKSEADDSSIQTNSEFVSLYQSASILKTYSNHSVQVVGFDSKEEMSADDSRKITEVFGEIISLHNKKDVLSSLVKVVDTLKNARKIPKSSL